MIVADATVLAIVIALGIVALVFMVAAGVIVLAVKSENRRE